MFRALDLEAHGLRWSHAPAVLAHPPRPDGGRAAVLYRDRDATAARLADAHPGDGEAWLRLCRQWDAVREPLLRTLFTTFPPVRGPVALLREIGTADALRLARFLLLPARRMGQELFEGEEGRLLLAGNAAHADAPGDAPVSGAYGWLLAMLGQQYGFPVPVGGAGELAAALARRAESAGATLRTGERVERIDVRGGRAVAVHTATGLTVRVRRAVIADVNAPTLYRTLLPAAALPRRLLDDLDHFEWDTPVVKVNWALDRPIPWRAPEVAGAGTVHLGADDLGLVRWSADLESRTLPASPYMLFGQMTTSDPSRSPAGTESAWAYTHLPRGIDDDASAEELARRVDATVEAFAPGFGERVVHRLVQRPGDLESAEPNLVSGAVNGGTAQLFQQLVFRPVPSRAAPRRWSATSTSAARPRTPVAGCTGSAAGSRRARRCEGRACAAACAAARCPPRSTCCTGVDRRIPTPRCTRHRTRAPTPAESPARVQRFVHLDLWTRAGERSDSRRRT